jgi:1-aminocyclopropane-1-carboxylate deaminase/D-cysteine desulfhydrase-like pyridoxal-dependent ACC family enzyme
MAPVHFKQHSGSAAPPADELAVVRAFAAARELKVVSLRPSHNHWYYWLRGKLTLSNLASMYVITVDANNGEQREIHLAVTRGVFKPTLNLKVLMEKGSA